MGAPFCRDCATKKYPTLSASSSLRTKEKSLNANCVQTQSGFTLQNRYPLKTRAKTKRLPTNVRSAICVQAQPAGFTLQNRYHTKNKNFWFKINFFILIFDFECSVINNKGEILKTAWTFKPPFPAWMQSDVFPKLLIDPNYWKNRHWYSNYGINHH